MRAPHCASRNSGFLTKTICWYFSAEANCQSSVWNSGLRNPRATSRPRCIRDPCRRGLLREAPFCLFPTEIAHLRLSVEGQDAYHLSAECGKELCWSRAHTPGREARAFSCATNPSL